MAYGKIETGRSGEEKAAAYLIKSGYRIMTRNFRNYLGEIDIVACDKDVICFIEVRTRRGMFSHENALSSVNFAKQRRLSRLALSFLKEMKLLERRARFDVISVSLGDIENDIFLLKDAFPVVAN